MTREPNRLRTVRAINHPDDLMSASIAFGAREGAAPGRESDTPFIQPEHAAGRHIETRRADSFAYRFVKRGLDIILASLLGLAALPIALLLAVFIAADSGRPVFFWQDRVGRLGRRFRLLKMRTLPRDVLEWPAETWYVQPDSRLMGIVRRAGLDELPQLWNVIRGEMSLVGPRPERPVFVEGFQARLPLYPLRHQLRPGLTGWAQIHGWRGDTSIGRRLEYDLDYLEHWSLVLDLRILVRTVLIVVRDLFQARGPASQ